MVLKLHSFARSTCGQRVATVLNEKGVYFEFHVVDPSKGEHKSPEYLEKQPFGQVPYIDDDGFILYESRAICRYIEAKYPGKGIKLAPSPDNLKAYGLFEQALSIESSNFNTHVAPAIREKVFKPMYGMPTDEKEWETQITALDGRLAVYDQILGKQKYLAGEELTMADLFHLPYGALLAQAGSDLMTSRPNVARWWNELTARPAWTAVIDGVKSTAAAA